MRRRLCEPTSCAAVAGDVQYAYRSMAVGTDRVVAWIDLDADKKVSANEPQASVDIGWTAPPGNTAYVAMGDSYSAGEGIGQPYQSGTDDSFAPAPNHCHRNDGAYGPLLSQSKMLRGISDLTLVACSGAETDDLFSANPVNRGETPQLDRIGAATKTVSLTIGGNDLGFVELLNACANGGGAPGKTDCTNPKSAAGTALRNGFDERLGAFLGRSTTRPDGSTITTIDKRTIRSLPYILRTIADKAPLAHIYVGGYPKLFGDPRLRGRNNGACTVGSTVLGPIVVLNSDIDWIRSAQERVNSGIEKVASRAQIDLRRLHPQSRVTYADAAAAFQGHGLCDYQASWINGVLFKGTFDYAVKPESFHPTATGQRNGYLEAFRKAGVGS